MENHRDFFRSKVRYSATRVLPPSGRTAGLPWRLRRISPPQSGKRAAKGGAVLCPTRYAPRYAYPLVRAGTGFFPSPLLESHRPRSPIDISTCSPFVLLSQLLALHYHLPFFVIVPLPLYFASGKPPPCTSFWGSTPRSISPLQCI